MKKILRFIRIATLLLLAVLQVSCNKMDPYSDNAFRKMLASLDWGNDVCLVYGHKSDVIPTLTEILGR